MSKARNGAIQRQIRILLALGVMLLSITPIFSNTVPVQAAGVTPTWADVQPPSDAKGGPGSSPLDTPVVTDTPTDIATDTPTDVATDTPQPSASPTEAPTTNVVGHVTLTGRGTPPNALWSIPITFSILPLGGESTVDYNLVTDNSGYFTATVISSGPYSWWLKQSQMLATSGTFDTSGGTVSLEAGSLRAGDADNDNCVNLRDFNIMRAAFGSSNGDTNWDPRVDFTGDGTVNVADFNLFARAYGLCGAQSIAPARPRTPTFTSTSTPTATRTSTRTFTRTNTPVSTSTSTSTNTRTFTPTGTQTALPTNTATNTSTSSPTATFTAQATVTNTSTDTPTSSPTNTSTNTPTTGASATTTNTATDTPAPGTVTVTPTPAQPTLLSVAVGPTNVAPASTIVLTYTLFSPAAQQVSLGAAIRANGSGANFFTDPINDRTVPVVAGNNVVIRYFALPNVSNVSYDVTWGLWGAGFVTEYGSIEQDNVVHVSGPSPTPVPVCNYSIVTSTGGVIVPGVDLVSRSHCTDCTVHIDMPFTYTLYDGQFSVIHAGNNGNVQFPTFTGISNGCLPEPAFNYVMVPYWEDLDTTDANDGIYTSVSGQQPNRILNIEWRAHNAATLAPVHFEVRIYEGQQKFEVIYDVVDQNGANAAVGVQRDTTTYQQYQCHAGGITPGMVLTFNYACGLPTATATASWTRTATSTMTPTGTATNTPTNTPTSTITATGTATNTATPAPPTATPSVPVLQNVALGPVQALGGSTIVMTYTVYSPNTQIVSLGGDMAPAGTGVYANDPNNDVQVQVVAGVNNVTRNFNLGARAPGVYDVRWGLFGPNFGTQYGLQVRSNALTILNITATPSSTATSTRTPTPGPSMTPTNTVPPTNTRTPAPSSPTATPSTPVLQSVALGPVQANAGSTIVMTYTLFSPGSQIVSLGGDMAPAGTGAYVNDPNNDRQVAVVPGENVITRNFDLGARSAGVYDVRWGLFGPNFGTQYGLIVQSNALTILSATVTPTGTATNTFTPSASPTGPTSTPSNTSIPTNTATGTPPTATRTRTATPTQNVTNTPTPGVPQLVSVSFSPANIPQGGTILMSFTIFSPAGGTYALGADIVSNANTYSDPGNDRLVTVPSGNSVVTRNFYVRPDDATGTYDIAFGLWNQAFTNQYGNSRLVRALVVSGATPTPSVGIPTYTPTTVPPPATPGVILDVTSPLTVTTSPLGSFTVSYRVRNTTAGNVSVKLRAALAPSGLEGYGSFTDAANESTVSVPPGFTTFTRPFAVPALTGAGSYDLTWSLISASTSAVLDTRTAKNLVWVNMTTTYTGLVSLAGESLATSSITLQNGIVNRVVGNFSILNEASTAQGVILRMRITRSGTQRFVNDLPGDTLIRVPVGTTNVSRSFAIPRYLPSGAYDVVFELGDPDFNGGFDNNTLNGALQITNPAVAANVGVPILMYHNINPTVPGGNWVKYDNFVAQMDYLVSQNYHTITGDDMFNYIYKGIALPTLPVWLTFDDGYQNIYDYAYPIMNARGLKASIFANTQWMGQMNSWDLCCEPQHLHMTWDMLQQMRNSGFSADSHTRHHVHFFEIPVPDQQSEVWGTQRDLMSFLGSPATNFSYPYGQYPDTAKWAIAHSGFLDGVVVVGQKQYTNYADMYELTRIGISDSDTITTFANKLTAP